MQGSVAETGRLMRTRKEIEDSVQGARPKTTYDETLQLREGKRLAAVYYKFVEAVMEVQLDNRDLLVEIRDLLEGSR